MNEDLSPMTPEDGVAVLKAHFERGNLNGYLDALQALLSFALSEEGDAYLETEPDLVNAIRNHILAYRRVLEDSATSSALHWDFAKVLASMMMGIFSLAGAAFLKSGSPVGVVCFYVVLVNVAILVMTHRYNLRDQSWKVHGLPTLKALEDALPRRSTVTIRAPLGPAFARSGRPRVSQILTSVQPPDPLILPGVDDEDVRLATRRRRL